MIFANMEGFIKLKILLGIIITANGIHHKDRAERQLSFFSVIKFPNLQCTTASDDTQLGTCMSAEDCGAAGGSKDGNCASGFGVCCLIKVKACGGTVKNNLTYIMNADYPSTTSTTGLTCTYVVKASGDSVCQLRMDFDSFVLNTPPNTATTSYGTCGDKFTVSRPTGGRSRFTALCGTNTGQHIYVETGQETTANSIAITTDTTSGNRKWKIRITQIDCESRWKAPTDCLQYHTGEIGAFKSFNYGVQTITENSYVICVRHEQGFCSIGYGVNKVTSVEPFLIDYVATEAAKRTITCDYVQIQIRTEASTSDIYCGRKFSSVKSDNLNSIVTSSVTPFKVYVTTESSQYTSTRPNYGFSLKYHQIPCGGSRNTQDEED